MKIIFYILFGAGILVCANVDAQHNDKSIPLDYQDSLILLDFTRGDIPGIEVENAAISTSPRGLTVKIAPGQEGAVTFTGPWDLTEWIYATIQIKNQGKEKIRFDPAISGKLTVPKSPKPLWSIGWLNPGELRRFNCPLLPDYSTRNTTYQKMIGDFPNMRGMPEGISFANSFDLEFTQQIQIRFPASKNEREVVLSSIYASRPSVSKLYKSEPKAFFPFIDRYGQYKHNRWPGKIVSDRQFKEDIKKEQKDLKIHQGPLEWSRFGGYKNGPKLKATGRFRTEKYNGKWWIVDPEGYLFWSMGVNSAGGLTVPTPVDGREHFFEYLPEKTDPVYGKFYNGDQYQFGQAVLYQKYGSTDAAQYARLSLKRLHSWGFNTLGGWSYEEVYKFPEKKRIPYTVSVSTTYPSLTDKFPDVFDPAWKQSVRNKLKAKAEHVKDDPFFLGFFVDNELHWYLPDQLASLVLQNSPANIGKRRYVELLRQRLHDIAAFNKEAGSGYKSWDELLQSQEILNVNKLEDINLEYYTELSSAYFKTIKEAIEEASPGSLYIGCRWHVGGNHRNRYNVPVGARYLDIISFNQYDNELNAFTYPGKDSIDKPYLISEFNFGALDRGKFYPGLNYASDQRNRGEKFVNFIESGLRDTHCVGAHWFMWANSTTAGRSVVGENANCGLVSETDQPYYELIEHIRKVAYHLYNYRLMH